VKTRKILHLAGIALLLCLLAGCEKGINVDAEMNGSSIELETGQTLTLKLDSNPTTGYDWDLIEIDPAILKQVGEVDYKPDSILTGSGGVNTYTFETVASGAARLKLIYHRAWETDSPPLETFILDVVVK